MLTVLVSIQSLVQKSTPFPVLILRKISDRRENVVQT